MTLGRALWSVAGLLAVAGAPGLASADGLGEPIHLEYRSPTGCPDEAAFVARIRGRTTAARFVEQGEAARTFGVVLETGSPPAGTVTVTEGERGGGARRLEADSCEHVADALALIVALALDPHALAAPTSVVADSGAAPAPKAALEASTPTPPVEFVEAAPPEIVAPPAPPSTSVPIADAPSKPAPAPSAHPFFVGADFVLATEVTPAALFTGSPYVGWRYVGTARVGPTVRAGFLRVAGDNVALKGEGTANFTWTVGRVDGCVTVWPRGRFKLSPCARVEVGALDVTGATFSSSGTHPLTPHSLWVSVGPLGRVEWTLVGPLSFDSDVGASFPLSPGSFIVQPGRTTAYQVPYVGFEAGAGLGLSFP